MQKIKQLNTLIDQTCTEAHNQPPVKLYLEILNIIESRVDMPKHSIVAISKKLTNKSKKILFICFDLLEYLAYNLELSFFNHIATKDFLFKISGLLMSKQLDPLIQDKILKYIKCLDELFRPLEDLLPLFFQFQAGLLRKQYQIPYEYVSPYRPKQLKQYKRPQKTEEQKKKPVIEPTKDQQRRFEQIRQKIILTNQIISNCDISQDVKKNDLLQEMMDQLKHSQKVINETINENPTQKILELALATNDDLVTTYRRYKDLQRNRKPQVFFMAQLASDIIKESSDVPKKIAQTKKSEPKIQSKTQLQKPQSIFQAFQTSSSNKPIQKPKVQSKTQVNNIFDLIDSTQKASQTTQITNALDLMDISPAQNSNQTTNNFNLDLLGSYSGDQNQSQNQTNIILGSIFSLDLGLSQPSNVNQPPQSVNLGIESSISQQPSMYQQPVYQAPIYQQPSTENSSSIEGLSFDQSLMASQYQNITLSTNEQKKPEPPVDQQKAITDMTDFKF